MTKDYQPGDMMAGEILPLQSFSPGYAPEISRIVCELIAKSYVRLDNVAQAISTVAKAFDTAAKSASEAPPAVELTPAVPPNKSVTPDYLISLEDGRKYKSLKRHLTTRGMTPDEYRKKWGLPHDYPMVCSAYSEQRSKLAKDLGLGRKANPAPEPAAVPVSKRKKA